MICFSVKGVNLLNIIDLLKINGISYIRTYYFELNGNILFGVKFKLNGCNYDLNLNDLKPFNINEKIKKCFINRQDLSVCKTLYYKLINENEIKKSNDIIYNFKNEFNL